MIDNLPRLHIFVLMLQELNKDREKVIREKFPYYPFPSYLGMEIDKLGYGTARISMKYRIDLTQGMNIIHGGAITSLCDTAIGIAIYTMIEEGRQIVTIELKINFISPADNDLYCEASIFHKGQKTAVGDVEVKKADGTLVAKGLATYFII